MSYKKRLFCILWALGIAGVLSFLLVDLSALIAVLPLPPGTPPVELSPLLLKLLSIPQPAVILTLAVLAGVWLAERVGLHSPAAEAIASGGPFFPALKPQIVPGVLTGLVAGVAIVVTWVVAKPFFSEEFAVRAQQFNTYIPFATRLLYGGLTEELLLRWGVMTFLVWAVWRTVQKGKGTPRPVYFIGAILTSAVLFGVGHLPIASMINGGLTVPIVTYVLVANSLFGIAAGFLFWKKGLEAAIIAHMSAHLVLITAIWLAL